MKRRVEGCDSSYLANRYRKERIDDGDVESSRQYTRVGNQGLIQPPNPKSYSPQIPVELPPQTNPKKFWCSRGAKHDKSSGNGRKWVKNQFSTEISVCKF